MTLIFYVSTAAVFVTGGSWLYWDWRIRRSNEQPGFAGGGGAIEQPRLSILRLRRTKSMFAMLVAGGVSITLMQLNKALCHFPISDGSDNAICDVSSDGRGQPVPSAEQ